MSTNSTAEPIVALDFPSLEAIPQLLEQIGSAISFYKVGLELYSGTGTAALDLLKNQGCRIFLDLKLHDIPRTVGRTVQAAAGHGVNLLTVHATGGRAMLSEAAKVSRDTENLAVIAVTTLTSMDGEDLKDIGVGRTLADQAIALTEISLQAGIDGIVTSVHECAALRKRFGPDPILVTPGIRMPSDNVDDQKRVATPNQAQKAGSSYLVVGRPITRASNPNAAARAILADLL